MDASAPEKSCFSNTLLPRALAQPQNKRQSVRAAAWASVTVKLREVPSLMSAGRGVETDTWHQSESSLHLLPSLSLARAGIQTPLSFRSRTNSVLSLYPS